MSDHNQPQIDMSRWGDRAASHEDVQRYNTALPHSAEKPIAISVTADEVGALFAAHVKNGTCDPGVYNQYLLERFKAAGAPVEGVIHFKLAHGAICKVKTNVLDPQEYFQYIWLPVEYALQIANAGKSGVA